MRCGGRDEGGFMGSISRSVTFDVSMCADFK